MQRLKRLSLTREVTNYSAVTLGIANAMMIKKAIFEAINKAMLTAVHNPYCLFYHLIEALPRLDQTINVKTNRSGRRARQGKKMISDALYT